MNHLQTEDLLEVIEGMVIVPIGRPGRHAPRLTFSRRPPKLWP